jgi:Asp-tRNA(Asn)/Glu-tRNA(Gln) amidotransferase A subunit family amidase
VVSLVDGALSQAADIDRTGCNGRRLCCVPVAIKDNIDLPPSATAAASLSMTRNFPLKPAVLVQRLVDFGAIVIARVNMAEFAFDGSNTNSSLVGATLNSYNSSHTPMGSSGGTGSRRRLHHDTADPHCH